MKDGKRRISLGLCQERSQLDFGNIFPWKGGPREVWSEAPHPKIPSWQAGMPKASKAGIFQGELLGAEQWEFSKIRDLGSFQGLTTPKPLESWRICIPKKTPLEEPERILLFGFSLDLFFLGCLQARFEFLDPSGNSSGWKEQGWISRCLNKFGISSDGSTGMGAGIKLGIVGRNVEMWQQIPQDTGILFFFFSRNPGITWVGRDPWVGVAQFRVWTSRVGEFGNSGIQSGKIQEFGHPGWENLEFRCPEWDSLGIWGSGVGKFRNLGIQHATTREFKHPEWENP